MHVVMTLSYRSPQICHAPRVLALARKPAGLRSPRPHRRNAKSRSLFGTSLPAMHQASRFRPRRALRYSARVFSCFNARTPASGMKEVRACRTRTFEPSSERRKKGTCIYGAWYCRTLPWSDGVNTTLAARSVLDRATRPPKSA